MKNLKKCVYSGKLLPKSQFNQEHIIPRALGGRGFKKIYVSGEANSRMGAEVDGKLEKDLAFQFARYKHGTKSASGKAYTLNIRPVYGVNDYDFKKDVGPPYTHFSLRGQPGTPLKIHNAKDSTETFVAQQSNANFFKSIVDHQARFKFSLKCLLAVDSLDQNWKLSNSFEMAKVQNALFSDDKIALIYINSLPAFSHPFLEGRSSKWVKLNKEFEKISHRNLPKAHFLVRNNGPYFEWSTKVLGILVSTIRFYRDDENCLPLKENELGIIFLTKKGCQLIKQSEEYAW